MEWSNSDILKLLDMYRERPVLWDPQDTYYKHPAKKVQAWDDIAKAFDADMVHVKMKVNSLLASYRRERQKMLARKAAGQHDFVSTWFAYESMTFLNNKYKPRKAIGMSQTDVDGDEGGGYEWEPGTILSEGFSYEPTILKHEIEDETLAAITGDHMSPSNKRPRSWQEVMPGGVVSSMAVEQDESGTFGSYVAHKLRGLDERTRAIAEHQISSVLFDAAMGKFSDAGQV